MGATRFCDPKLVFHDDARAGERVDHEDDRGPEALDLERSTDLAAERIGHALRGNDGERHDHDGDRDDRRDQQRIASPLPWRRQT